MKWKVRDCGFQKDTPEMLLVHDCVRVGEIEAEKDWHFCPYCGHAIPKTAANALKAARQIFHGE